jgi:uncharacterized protein YkwD
MRRKGLFSFFVVLASALNLFAAAEPSSAAADEYRIFSLINQQRTMMSLAPFEWDDQLAAIARNYSAQMAREGFFDHTDRNGEAVNDRADRAGVDRWRRIGENLFMCGGIRDFSNMAVEQWMRSPGHRNNILDRRFNATGIGIARARNGRIYVTEVFVQD